MKSQRDYDTRLANLEARRHARKRQSRREREDAQADAIYAQLLSDAIEHFGLTVDRYATAMSRVDPMVADELSTRLVNAYMLGSADLLPELDSPIALIKTPEGYRLIEREESK